MGAMPLAGRPTNDAEAIAWLVEQVPELRPLLDEHVAFHGELLPYLLFESDFLDWFKGRTRAGDHEPAQRFVASMETLMTTGDGQPALDAVSNLAGVCFVEALVMGGADNVIKKARTWMGPNTERDIDRMYRYRSGELKPSQ